MLWETEPLRTSFDALGGVSTFEAVAAAVQHDTCIAQIEDEDDFDDFDDEDFDDEFDDDFDEDFDEEEDEDDEDFDDNIDLEDVE